MSTDTLRIRCGDHVHHIPSGEDWVVAYADYVTGYLSWCGWPDGEAKIADCRLIKRATDAEHLDWLTQIANGDGRRGARAREELEAMAAA